MAGINDSMLHEGVSVNVYFAKPLPTFGDLFPICGQEHPRFPPTGNYRFEQFADLQFDQCDDYFGVRNIGEVGDDVAVWLYPLVRNEPVDHHLGPFEGVRLDYNVLRNPAHLAEHYLKSIERFAAIGEKVHYRSRDADLGSPINPEPIKQDIAAITQYWTAQGVIVGSDEALQLDF